MYFYTLKSYSATLQAKAVVHFTSQFFHIMIFRIKGIPIIRKKP